MWTSNVADCLLASCAYPISFSFFSLFKQSVLRLFHLTVKLFNSQYLICSLGPYFCFVLLFSFPLFLESYCSCKPRLPLCHFRENLISYHLAAFPAQEESFRVQRFLFLILPQALPPAPLDVCCFCWVL